MIYVEIGDAGAGGVSRRFAGPYEAHAWALKAEFGLGIDRSDIWIEDRRPVYTVEDCRPIYTCKDARDWSVKMDDMLRRWYTPAINTHLLSNYQTLVFGTGPRQGKLAIIDELYGAAPAPDIDYWLDNAPDLTVSERALRRARQLQHGVTEARRRVKAAWRELCGDDGCHHYPWEDE